MKIRIKRKRNNLVPPFKLCKLIPAGEFKKSVLVWELNVCEKLDEKGNVIECHKWLNVCDRDAIGKKHKVPKTAKQRLKSFAFYHTENREIFYTEAIYPAPTLQEILEKLPRTVKLNFWGDDFHVYNDVQNGHGVSDKNPAIAALKLLLKQKGIEA